jgi:hypothetical protein
LPGPGRALSALVPATLLLAACGSDNNPGPGGVTVGEARALDDAAEMLDARRPPDSALPSAGPSAPAKDAASQG